MRLTGPAPALPDDAVTKLYVDAATLTHIEQVTVDFGDDDTTAGASVLASWVTAGSVIHCVPATGGTLEHTAEDAAVEGVLCTVTYVEPGIGFDVLAFCPGGTSGTYSFTCVAA